MRYEKTAALLRLAQRLAGTSEGLTLDEMAQEAGADRRTAERMRDALRDLFPMLEEVRDGRAKRFKIPGGLDGFLQCPTVDEMAELEAAIRSLDRSGGDARASLLRSLSAKIRAALRAPARQRIEPDLDVLFNAEASTLQVGPRPLADADTLAKLREALKACRVCIFHYGGTTTSSPRPRRVHPYGILFGKAYYLVGPEEDKAEPVLWRLDRMSSLNLGGPAPAKSPAFSLADFAARSFGAFQEEPADIVLKFNPEAAFDACRFLFHPSQSTEELEDGSVIVRFRSGGLLELVRHLFTWGSSVQIIAPRRLRQVMISELETALIRHRMET